MAFSVHLVFNSKAQDMKQTPQRAQIKPLYLQLRGFSWLCSRCGFQLLKESIFKIQDRLVLFSP
jgi:hypothetical protein